MSDDTDDYHYVDRPDCARCTLDPVLLMGVEWRAAVSKANPTSERGYCDACELIDPESIMGGHNRRVQSIIREFISRDGMQGDVFDMINNLPTYLAAAVGFGFEHGAKAAVARGKFARVKLTYAKDEASKRFKRDVRNIIDDGLTRKSHTYDIELRTVDPGAVRVCIIRQSKASPPLDAKQWSQIANSLGRAKVADHCILMTKEVDAFEFSTVDLSDVTFNSGEVLAPNSLESAADLLAYAIGGKD